MAVYGVDEAVGRRWGWWTSIMSVGRATAFPTPTAPLSPREAGAGVFAVLHNNYWDTNYPYWYPFTSANLSIAFFDADSEDRFRFNVSWN